MNPQHPLLRRQLASHLRSQESIPDGWLGLLDAVDNAYQQADDDRKLLERSLDLSSQELIQANAEMRAVIESHPDLFFWIEPCGRISGCRFKESDDLLLVPRILIGKRIDGIPDADASSKFVAALSEMRSGAARVTIEYTLDHAGECRYYEARLVRQDSEQILVVVRNITSRRRAEIDLQIKEEHLRHALKMEAIGLLAGGIAHDFNNLVTAIGGYSELVLEQLAPNDPVREDVVEIQRAGTSAAALTRQLLAFASRQILSPRVIDLNEAVCRTESLLGRLIRENITLETQLAPGGDSIRADPGEIEQIIINLVVNARDAMPEGGSIVVGTSGVEIVEPTETSLGSLKPGRYTMLYVSDTGSGIAEADLPHIFEPFFTTKEVGSGTGLGLATVYGIVKQSGGVLSVRSELSVGTTFEILFPICQEVVAEAEDPIRAGHIRGTETVLLVEDQHGVRSVTKAILQRSGYQVIEASDGISAQKLGEDHPGVIDLLLSDMVLPSLNGRVLAERLTESRPSMRVLLTSGYTDDRIALKGIEERRYSFVPKPYGSQQLLAKVREVLGTPTAEMNSAAL